jgi:ribosomal protein S6
MAEERTGEEKDKSETRPKPQHYEAGYHFAPTAGDDALAAEVARLRESIEGAGGVIVKEQALRRMSLAYTIERRRGGSREKFKTSYFGWILFEGSTETARTLSEVLKSNEALIRYLVIKTEKEELVHPRPRSVFKRSAVRETEQQPAPTTTAPVSTDELDKEIERLVSE